MSQKYILILCFLGDPTCPPGSFPGTGGFNASVNELIGPLIRNKELNYKIITNTTGKYNNVHVESIACNVTLYRIYSSPSNLLNKNEFSNDIYTYIKSIEEIISNFSDIAFIHSFYWLSGKIASNLSQRYSIPFIHTTVSLAIQKLQAGIQPEIEKQLEMEKEFLSKAKYIFAITEEEKHTLTTHYNIDEIKILVEGQLIDNAYHEPICDNYGMPFSYTNFSINQINPITFNNPNPTSDSLWWNVGAFTYIGRITKTKGLDFIIKAWLSLHNKFTTKVPPLWIIGNTPEEIDDFRKSLDIPESVLIPYEMEKKIVWWGYLNAAGISTILLKTSVLVTHSPFEAGGRMILESSCQGVPVISTNTGFAKDYIHDWLNGFIVAYGDVETLALRMSHFIMQPFLSVLLGENAKNLYQQLELNWNKSERIIHLYKCLFHQKQYSDSYKYHFPIIEDAFKSGIIQSYPFYYRKLDKSILESFINSYEHNTIVFSDNFKKLSVSNIWNYNNNYVIKQIYSKCNYDKLWNQYEASSVWDTDLIWGKIMAIRYSDVILPILATDTCNDLILHPYIKIITKNTIRDNIISITQCLKNFSETPVPDIIVQFQLSTFWNELKDNIQLLSIKKLQTLLSMVPVKIDKYLSCDMYFGESYCLQYGISIVNHCGFFVDKLFLLPTYHWVYSQSGLDASLLLLEILSLEQTIDIYTITKFSEQLSQMLNIPIISILCWSICVTIKNILQSSLYSIDDYDSNDKIISNLLIVLNNLI